MKDNKTIYVLLSVVSTLLGAIGQFLFKYSFTDGTIGLTLAIGVGVYALSTAIYFYVLSRVNLSWAYGLSGITYIATVIFAATLLSEQVSPLRWAGVLVIALGVVFVSLS